MKTINVSYYITESMTYRARVILCFDDDEYQARPDALGEGASEVDVADDYLNATSTDELEELQALGGEVGQYIKDLDFDCRSTDVETFDMEVVE